jgi:imidazolonepropionase-like amidohydrolase
MRLVIWLAFLATVPTSAYAGTTVISGAQVWNGKHFEVRTLAVRDGRFVRVPRNKATVEKLDLSGRYIVPAYANAHCHVTSADRASSDGFLRAGVFYVWNPNSIVLSSQDKAFFGTATTYSLKIAQGGITEPRGHPEPLYTDILAKYVYKGREKEWFIGNAFHYGRTPEEIVTVLDKLKSQGADFVKAYLLHSEDYEMRKDDPKFEGARGLNPANMPFLVAGARRRGMKVAVHVETAADLVTAAQSGAAVAAHLPGYGGSGTEAMKLSAEQARIVANSGIRLTPTYGLAAGLVDEKASLAEQKATADANAKRQLENMVLLKNSRAAFIMGTDGLGPVFEEAERWVAIGGMTDPEAARVVFETGAWLFPDRRIGCFQPGCEADFLVLASDPTLDIRNLRAIEQRYKAGKVLNLPDLSKDDALP